MSIASSSQSSDALPLFVHLGFAGARRLLKVEEHPDVDAAAFEAEVEKWLVQRLQSLRDDLRLRPHHYLCGVSALAAGADTIFARACQTLDIPLRVFLPQTRNEFLHARGTRSPDFTDQQREEANRLLDAPHVIQERLVSDAADRHERFRDTNREIVRVSDVLLCVLSKDQAAYPGGTWDLVRRASHRGKRVLKVTVDVIDGKPAFTEAWVEPESPDPATHDPADDEPFPPELPHTLRHASLKPADSKVSLAKTYIQTVKQIGSDTANRLRRKFKRLAIVVVVAHVAATVLATIALAAAGLHAVPILLALELALLLSGLIAHQKLHTSHILRNWAEARLLAEIGRSMSAFANLHFYPDHLFKLPFPRSVRSILRSLTVFYLQSTKHDTGPWEPKRDAYLFERLTKPKGGQIDYYSNRENRAAKEFSLIHRLFKWLWIIAFSATTTKLIIHLFVHIDEPAEAILNGVLGTLAIVTPVLAAGSLSFGAALDLEARMVTYRDMVKYLKQQKRHIQTATSERDFAHLVLETETVILGETANWFARRSVTGIS
jgi:hypothetical protein